MAKKLQDVRRRNNGRRILASMAAEVDKIRAAKIKQVEQEYRNDTNATMERRRAANARERYTSSLH